MYIKLTFRVTLQERVKDLQVTGDLLSCPPLPCQFVDVFCNKFISSVGFSTLRPFPSTHGRVCLKGYNVVSILVNLGYDQKDDSPC